jgi:hypothetical protein
MAGPDYDAMSDEEETAETEAVEDEEATAAEDEEFLMHAEEAGFTGEKAAALWRAIERCNELSSGAGVVLEDAAEDEELL